MTDTPVTCTDSKIKPLNNDYVREYAKNFIWFIAEKFGVEREFDIDFRIGINTEGCEECSAILEYAETHRKFTIAVDLNDIESISDLQYDLLHEMVHVLQYEFMDFYRKVHHGLDATANSLWYMYNETMCSRWLKFVMRHSGICEDFNQKWEEIQSLRDKESASE